jgi:hypothetical protein
MFSLLARLCLLQRRETWRPTILGWLCSTLLFAVPMAWWCSNGELFLSSTRRLPADVLVARRSRGYAASRRSLPTQNSGEPEILRQSFLNYRLIRKPVAIIGKAVSDKIGSNVMWIHEPGSAMNTLNPKWVETLKTDEAIRWVLPLAL